jgi:hypothetical protein
MSLVPISFRSCPIGLSNACPDQRRADLQSCSAGISSHFPSQATGNDFSTVFDVESLISANLMFVLSNNWHPKTLGGLARKAARPKPLLSAVKSEGGSGNSARGDDGVHQGSQLFALGKGRGPVPGYHAYPRGCD